MTSDNELVDQLLRRVDVLEGDKRRWKRIAFTALTLLVLLVVGGSLLLGSLGTVWYRSARARLDAEHALMQAEIQANLQAQRAQQAAEQARLEAEKARRDAEQPAKEQ